jgi:hypothetical protein
MPAPFNLSLYSSLMNYHFNCKFYNTNETYYKFNQFDCDILFSKYMKCLVGQNTNCEKLHDQFEKCLYLNHPNQE